MKYVLGNNRVAVKNKNNKALIGNNRVIIKNNNLYVINKKTMEDEPFAVTSWVLADATWSDNNFWIDKSAWTDELGNRHYYNKTSRFYYKMGGNFFGPSKKYSISVDLFIKDWVDEGGTGRNFTVDDYIFSKNNGSVFEFQFYLNNILLRNTTMVSSSELTKSSYINNSWNNLRYEVEYLDDEYDINGSYKQNLKFYINNTLIYDVTNYGSFGSFGAAYDINIAALTNRKIANLEFCNYDNESPVIYTFKLDKIDPHGDLFQEKAEEDESVYLTLVDRGSSYGDLITSDVEKSHDDYIYNYIEDGSTYDSSYFLNTKNKTSIRLDQNLLGENDISSFELEIDFYYSKSGLAVADENLVLFSSVLGRDSSSGSIKSYITRYVGNNTDRIIIDASGIALVSYNVLEGWNKAKFKIIMSTFEKFSYLSLYINGHFQELTNLTRLVSRHYHNPAIYIGNKANIISDSEICISNFKYTAINEGKDDVAYYYNPVNTLETNENREVLALENSSIYNGTIETSAADLTWSNLGPKI